MGLNLELAGKEYPSTSYEVTAEAIHKYAAATNEDNPAFTGDSPVAPPVFPIVASSAGLTSVLFDPELRVDLPRMLHGEQEHMIHSLMKAGDEVKVETVLETVEQKETGETFTILCRLVDEQDQLLAEVRSLMFIRGTGTSKKRRPQEESARDYQFEVKQQIDEDQTFRYAESSGDHNPIHVDNEFAKSAAGLPGIIVHGMCTMAFASKAVLDSVCGSDPACLQRIKVRMTKPVFPGQAITTRGWGESTSRYAFETVNENGDLVLSNCLAEVRS